MVVYCEIPPLSSELWVIINDHFFLTDSGPFPENDAFMSVTLCSLLMVRQLLFMFSQLLNVLVSIVEGNHLLHVSRSPRTFFEQLIKIHVVGHVHPSIHPSISLSTYWPSIHLLSIHPSHSTHYPCSSIHLSILILSFRFTGPLSPPQDTQYFQRTHSTCVNSSDRILNCSCMIISCVNLPSGRCLCLGWYFNKLGSCLQGSTIMHAFVLSVYVCRLFKVASVVCSMGSATVNTLHATHVPRCLVVAESKLEICLSAKAGEAGWDWEY